MALFTLIALGATGIGPAYAGWIEMNPKLEWKWVEWVHMMQVSCHLLKRTEKLTDIYQDERSISYVAPIRHERNAFVDSFDQDRKETQKNNRRSTVSC